MSPHLLRAQTWFMGLQTRERLLVALSAAALIWLAFDYGLLQPRLAERAKLHEDTGRATQEAQALSAQVKTLEARRGQDPNAKLRAEVESLRARLAELEAGQDFSRVGHIAPEDMTNTLREMLALHPGVELTGLKTLAAQRMDEHGTVIEGNTDTGPGLRRFGVSLTLRGDYRALTAYLASLETGPARWLWGEARLEVATHPMLDLTLVLYTLGDQDTWLKV
jgi:MSHA biogenesis protein MshJ